MTLSASRWPALALVLGGLLVGTARAAEAKMSQSALIDDKLAEKWKANDLKAAPKANDLQFLRRVFLDLIGRVPTIDEVKHFEADVAPGKRSRIISRLLRDKEYKIKVSAKETLTFYYAEEYARHWANVWDTWLMTRGGLDRMYHEQMENWLEKQFVDNTPYNELVEKLVTATGKTNENPAVNFVLSHMGEAVPANDKASQGNFDFVPLTSRVTRLFLGVQVQCTQCHDHPFNPEWTQENFWGVNSFLRQVNRSGTPLQATGNRKKMMATNIDVSDDAKLNDSMRVFYERRSGVLMSIRPTMLADLEKKDTPKRVMSSAAAGKTRRQMLNDYMVGHDNFPKAVVNRYWGQLFGRGMNEQSVADDFGDHNKLVHPELLAALGEEFVKYRYDLKQLLEWICNSDTYQLGHTANESNGKDESAPYFSRMALKAMSPEVLYLSILKATGSEAKSTEVKENRQDFLGKLVRQFGDDEGNEQLFNGTVVQALLLMNGREINDEIKKGQTIDKAMKRYEALMKATPAKYEEEVIDDIYLSVLGRHVRKDASLKVEGDIDPKTKRKGPTRMMSELGFILDAAKKADLGSKKDEKAYKAFYEDLMWSLLNTSEFILNH